VVNKADHLHSIVPFRGTIPLNILQTATSNLRKPNTPIFIASYNLTISLHA
jgi:hypothetical protein